MFELQQHTADVRIALRAGSLEELFSEAVRSLAAVMQPQETGETHPHTFRFEVDSIDATSLLIDFLSDVLVRMHVDHACFDRVLFSSISETHVTGVAHGRAPVEFEEDVKAVTYHEAEVVQISGVWSTGIVLDL